jgi:hypothetical protein
LGACVGASDSARRGEPKGGGAAREWSPERPRRRWPAAELAGSRGGGGREREGEGQGHGEDQGLTLSTPAKTASPEVAGIAGERRRPAARAPAKSADSGRLRLRGLAEEDGGDAAELMVASAWRGEAQSSGDGERPELGFRARCRKREGGGARGGKEIGTRGRRAGGSPGRRPHPRGEQEVAGVGLPAQGTQLPAWQRKKTRAFCPKPPAFSYFL